MNLDFDISTNESVSFTLDTAGTSRGMSACEDGNYYSKNTVIPLTIDLSDYKYLYFLCGEDSRTEGIQTSTIPLHTKNNYHRLTWDIADGILRPVSKLFQLLVVNIDENRNTVTIAESNVSDYGIRKIIAG